MDTCDPAPNIAEYWSENLDRLRELLEKESAERRRSQCMSKIQNHTVQLALDLVVREEDIEGFFRAFMKSLIDMGDSHACTVWLLNDDSTKVELWMKCIGDTFYSKDCPAVQTRSQVRDLVAAHLMDYKPGWTETIDYTGDDQRLPQAVRDFNLSIGSNSIQCAPLVLPSRNLGWMMLSTIDATPEDTPWRRALLDSVARQATLALHQSRLAERSRLEARHQAVLEERNRIARDIHDTLAQGFAGILMQLQSVQRVPNLPPNIAKRIDDAVDLARTHMIEARRSVGALRPQEVDAVDVAAGLERTADLARRTTDVPIELVIGDLPAIGATVEREILSIAQEALVNAVRHASARRITVHASATKSDGLRLSVADDGRGIANERFGTGFGLTSMQERADRIGGSLTIVTAPRAGTEIVLAWEPAPFSIPAP